MILYEWSPLVKTAFREVFDVRVTGRALGRTVGGEQVAAFVPYPLPPREPPLEMDPERYTVLIKGKSAGLSSKEFELLKILVAADGKPLNHEE